MPYGEKTIRKEKKHTRKSFLQTIGRSSCKTIFQHAIVKKQFKKHLCGIRFHKFEKLQYFTYTFQKDIGEKRASTIFEINSIRDGEYSRRVNKTRCQITRYNIFEKKKIAFLIALKTTKPQRSLRNTTPHCTVFDRCPAITG